MYLDYPCSFENLDALIHPNIGVISVSFLGLCFLRLLVLWVVGVTPFFVKTYCETIFQLVRKLMILESIVPLFIPTRASELFSIAQTASNPSNFCISLLLFLDMDFTSISIYPLTTIVQKPQFGVY